MAARPSRFCLRCSCIFGLENQAFLFIWFYGNALRCQRYYCSCSTVFQPPKSVQGQRKTYDIQFLRGLFGPWRLDETQVRNERIPYALYMGVGRSISELARVGLVDLVSGLFPFPWPTKAVLIESQLGLCMAARKLPQERKHTKIFCWVNPHTTFLFSMTRRPMTISTVSTKLY